MEDIRRCAGCDPADSQIDCWGPAQMPRAELRYQDWQVDFWVQNCRAVYENGTIGWHTFFFDTYGCDPDGDEPLCDLD